MIITTIGCISNIYASAPHYDMCDHRNMHDNVIYESQLQELFDIKNNTLVFNNGVISFNNQIVNPNDYKQLKNDHGNNTIYINTNTLPINSNTGIKVFANIAGYDNISLQDFDSTHNVPNSITFHGDNTKYNGIFYLPTDINAITFDKNNSIIKKLNIPVKHDQFRNITIYIPNEVYASIVQIPLNLNIEFYNDSKQIFPNSKLRKQLMDEYSEDKHELNSYKITSKSYEKYKPSVKFLSPLHVKEIYGRKKEFDYDIATERVKNEIICNINNRLQALEIHYNIKDIKDVFRLPQELTSKIKYNIKQILNTEMKTLLTNEDKNCIDKHKTIKENLSVLREKIEKYVIDEVNKALSNFSGYGYKQELKNKDEIEKIFVNLKDCIEKAITAAENNIETTAVTTLNTELQNLQVNNYRPKLGAITSSTLPEGKNNLNTELTNLKNQIESNSETAAVTKLNEELNTLGVADYDSKLGAITSSTVQIGTHDLPTELATLKTTIENNDKLAVIQQLVNECAKQLVYNKYDITLKSDYSVNSSGNFSTAPLNGTIECNDNIITITAGNTTFTINANSDNPTAIKDTVNNIEKNMIHNLIEKLANVYAHKLNSTFDKNIEFNANYTIKNDPVTNVTDKITINTDNGDLKMTISETKVLLQNHIQYRYQTRYQK